MSETDAASYTPRFADSAAFRAILCENASFFENHSPVLLEKWTHLYLTAFGRKAFFAPERVRKIFQEMLARLVECLKRSDADAYAGVLRQKGEVFAEAGVPFEEVILCLQLFDEACISLALENRKVIRHKLEDILVALEEFGHASTAILAASYFKASKKHWQKACRGYQEETERLRGEFQSLHDEFFISAKNDLRSMELMIHGINQRLRKSVILSRRVQIFSDLLDREAGLKSVLKIADKFFRQILPPDSGVLFGIFDENQKKFALYQSAGQAEDNGESGVGVMEEVYFSQLPLEFQESLFKADRPVVHFEDPRRLVFLNGYSPFGHAADFLFLPLQKYRDAIGFVLLAAPEKGVFVKPAFKYYLRLAKTLAQAAFGVIYFNRAKKHSDFISVMDQLHERVLQRNPIESTLDFCLGSLIELLGVERASLMLLDKKTRSLSMYAAKGYKVFPFSGLILKWGEGIAGWSVKESKIVCIPRMREERLAAGRSAALEPASRELGVRSLLCIPLVHEDETIGALNLSTLTYHKHFEQSEIDMTNQFAHKIAAALATLASVKDFETYIRPYLRHGEEIYP